MKSLHLLLLFGILYSGTVSAAFALSDADRKIVQDMRSTVVALKSKVKSAESSNAKTLRALNLVRYELAALREELVVAETRIQEVVRERDALYEEIIIAKKKQVELNRKYQAAQFIIAITVAVIAGMFVLYFTQVLPPPYNFAAPLGASVAAFAAVYFIL